MQVIIILVLFFITKNVLLKPIETENDALTYLTQLGYNENECNSTSKLQCSVSLSSIISEYQKAFGLKETGQLDKPTKELLNKPRCGNRDTPQALLSASLGSASLGSNKPKWKKNHLKWKLSNPSLQISQKRTIQIIHQAFEAWTRNIPLNIERVCTKCPADVVFDFAHGDHHDGFPFDGPGKVLAHAFFPEDGRVHFDESEKWTERFDGNDLNLFLVALHEIGHALGLGHNTHDQNSIMYPTYQFMDKKRTLPDTDRQSIIDRYESKEIRKSLDPYNNMIAVLRNKATQKVLESNSNKDVYTLDHNGDDNQKWVFTRQDDGTYVLQNVATSFVLDSNKERMYTLNLNGSPDQKWRFYRQTDGSYVLENLATSRVLDSNHAGKAYPLDSNGSNHQKWYLEVTGVNPYNGMIAFLRNKATQKVLESNSNKGVYTLDHNGGNYQKWVFTQQDNGTYVLENVATSFALDSDNERMYTLDLNGTPHQKWRFHRQNDGSYVLENLATSRFLDSNDAGKAYPLDSNGNDHQKWYLEVTGVNPYNGMIAFLRNKATQKVLESNSNKDVYTLDHNSDDNQKWVFTRQDDGTYVLQNVATSFVLDSNNERMYTLNLNGSPDQKWRFYRQTDGSYVLENLATSRVLDSNHAGKAYPLDSNGSNHQKWYLEVTGVNPYNGMIAFLRNKATQKVLESNSNKGVYTLDHNGGNYQKWVFTQQDDGTYVLQNVATSFGLDSNNQWMYTLDLNGSPHQQWRFHRQNDGSYVLENLATSRVLDSNHAGDAYPRDSNGNDHQKWYLEVTGVNPYNGMIAFLRNKATEKVLGSSLSNDVYTLDHNSDDNQKWVFTQQDNGTYVLENVATSFALDSDNERIYTLNLNGSPHQKWRFHRQKDGSYVLENLATSRFLDSNHAGKAYPLDSNGSNHQKWFVEAV